MNALKMKEISFPSNLFFSFIIIFNAITFANHSHTSEVLTLLGCYTAVTGSYWSVGTAYQYHLQRLVNGLLLDS